MRSAYAEKNGAEPEFTNYAQVSGIRPPSAETRIRSPARHDTKNLGV